MLFSELARYFGRLEETSGRNALVGILAELFTETPPLSFPRVVSFRNAERRPEEATTVEEIVELYEHQGATSSPG